MLVQMSTEKNNVESSGYLWLNRKDVLAEISSKDSYLFILDLQRKLNLMKCQGTGEIGSWYQVLVISRFFSVHYTITGLKNIVHYTKDVIM